MLGIWVAAAEGAKAWAQALAQLRNRPGGGAVRLLRWPVRPRRGDHRHLAGHDGADLHLIRRSLNYASYTGQKAMAAGLRGVYNRLRRGPRPMPRWPISPARRWGRSTQRAVAVWERAWDQFIPFLEYGPAMRKVLYTTNATESFNREMRKILKTRTQFPDDDSVAKKLWLAILDSEKRAEQRARQAGKPKAQRDAVLRLIEGHVTQGWREAWDEMTARWPDRFAGRF